MSALDWPGLLDVALARGLSPERLWAMTPVEFARLTGRDARGPVPMTRAGFDALLAAYPDRKGEPEGG